MKKLTALLLAVLMILPVSAFASTFTESITVLETDDKYTGSDVSEIGTNTADANTPKTELWLQVDASGQIDVTVPLVLVFKTNIDGGAATSPETYKITNNSSAELTVTKLSVSAEAYNEATNPMELVAYSTDANPTYAEDKYAVQLSVTDTNAAAGTVNKYDLKTASTTAYEATAASGGLFPLEKATAAGVGTDTRITVDMSTGKLSFVTKVPDAQNNEYGVKLLTVYYTVAINTENAIGAAITSNEDPTVNGATVSTGN